MKDTKERYIHPKRVEFPAKIADDIFSAQSGPELKAAFLRAGRYLDRWRRRVMWICFGISALCFGLQVWYWVLR